MDDLSLRTDGVPISRILGTLAQWLPVIMDPQAQLTINGTCKCNSIDSWIVCWPFLPHHLRLLQRTGRKQLHLQDVWERLGSTIALRMDQFSYQDLELDNFGP